MTCWVSYLYAPMTTLRKSMGFVTLDFPDEPGLLEAAGKVALAHGQLELMLRMTIKSLDGLDVRDALTLTHNMKNWQLRKAIEDKFCKRTRDPALHARLRTILRECKDLSDHRNLLLHNAWAIAFDGSIVTKGETHAWGPAPNADELTTLATKIKQCVAILNEARLVGFIKDVCR